MKAATAGWVFAAPALTVIAVFFGLPVLAAFALSLTDFDIYALADLHNLRFVGLGNYIGLLHNALFWQALGNTMYFVGVGVPLSIAVSPRSRKLRSPSATRCVGRCAAFLFEPPGRGLAFLYVGASHAFATQSCTAALHLIQGLVETRLAATRGDNRCERMRCSASMPSAAVGRPPSRAERRQFKSEHLNPTWLKFCRSTA